MPPPYPLGPWTYRHGITTVFLLLFVMVSMVPTFQERLQGRGERRGHSAAATAPPGCVVCGGGDMSWDGYDRLGTGRRRHTLFKPSRKWSVGVCLPVCLRRQDQKGGRRRPQITRDNLREHGAAGRVLLCRSCHDSCPVATTERRHQGLPHASRHH